MFVRGLSSLKKGSPARDARRGKRPVLQAPPRHSPQTLERAVEICKTLARRTPYLRCIYGVGKRTSFRGRTTEFDNAAIFGASTFPRILSREISRRALIK